MPNRDYEMNNLTAGEASDILKVSTKTLTKWSDQGRIKHWKINQDRRFHIDDLVDFAKANNMAHLLEKNLEAISDSTAGKDMTIEALNAKLKKAEEACKIAIDCLCDSKFSISENCFKINSDKKKAAVQALEGVVINV